MKKAVDQHLFFSIRLGMFFVREYFFRSRETIQLDLTSAWICLKCLEQKVNIFSQMVVKNGDESHGTLRKEIALNKSKIRAYIIYPL